MMTNKKRSGFNRPLMIGCIAWICSLCSTGWSAKIVYPWRATTAIVEAGKTFDVWFVADSGQTVNSVQLQGPYNSVNVTIGQVSGSWVYDKISGNTYNKKITVTVPASAPEERYDLVVKTSTGDVKSQSAVKVVKQYKSSYYIMHISDVHRYQGGYNPTNILKRVSKIVDYANIIDAQMIIETGDLMYGVDGNPNREDAMYNGIASMGINGLNDCFAATFMVDGNHDNPTDASVYGDPVASAKYFNTYHGLTHYNFAYGNGRFMIIANSIGANGTAQVTDAMTWMNGAIGSGNFRLGAFHGPTGGPVNDLATVADMTLGLAGHTHTTASNPELNNVYASSDLRANFQFNLFKVDNDTGDITVVPGVRGSTDAILNMADKDNPPAWQLKLTLNYARTNNGSSTSNTATIVNKFSFPIDQARVRFLMPKGNTYKVSAGTILQAFDGTTFHIVDVRVNLPANNSTTVVGISKVGSAQVSVPNVINLTESAAKSSMTGAGLIVSGVSSNFHATVAAGIIYSQTPGAGTLVASNSSVALAVSKGPSNQPPYFVSSPFSLADATEGAAYSQSISGSAIDPEGGTKTFSKVAGPIWLSISAVGTVTGIPGSVDGGNNSFSVSVVDQGGLSATATMTIKVNRTTTTVPWVTNLTESAAKSGITGAGLTVSGVNSNFHATVAAGIIYSQTPGGGSLVSIGSSVALAVSKGPTNQPPTFISNPFAIADATSGTAYSQSISGSAVDPEAGTKTYSKVSGPAWLSISGSGTVTGTPGTTDVGTNSFSVSVTDVGGLSASASMTIKVIASTTTVPWVTNLTEAAAGTAITNAGLVVSGVNRQYHATIAAGRVYSQTPGGNTSAIRGSSVALAVSLGQEPPSVPVVGSIITLKAVNGKYVSATFSTNNTLIANKTNNLTNYERFKVVNATNSIALQCMGNNQFVSINVPNGSKPMLANRSTIGSYEKFNLVQSGTNLTIQSVLSTNYVSAVSNGVAPLQASQTYVGAYEKFTWKVE